MGVRMADGIPSNEMQCPVYHKEEKQNYLPLHTTWTHPGRAFFCQVLGHHHHEGHDLE